MSLKMFYQIVGSCNFAWNYGEKEEIPWEGADPIQIAPIEDVLSEIKEFENHDLSELQVSADYLHKDNISGGLPYSIEITREPQVDSLFLNEEHNLTFVKYLRMIMENCGFGRVGEVMDRSDFIEYYKKVKPKLQSI